MLKSRRYEQLPFWLKGLNINDFKDYQFRQICASHSTHVSKSAFCTTPKSNVFFSSSTTQCMRLGSIGEESTGSGSVLIIRQTVRHSGQTWAYVSSYIIPLSLWLTSGTSSCKSGTNLSVRKIISCNDTGSVVCVRTTSNQGTYLGQKT